MSRFLMLAVIAIVLLSSSQLIQVQGNEELKCLVCDTIRGCAGADVEKTCRKSVKHCYEKVHIASGAITQRDCWEHEVDDSVYYNPKNDKFKDHPELHCEGIEEHDVAYRQCYCTKKNCNLKLPDTLTERQRKEEERKKEEMRKNKEEEENKKKEKEEHEKEGGGRMFGRAESPIKPFGILMWIMNMVAFGVAVML